MTTPSSDIVSRSYQTFEVRDALGRDLKIRRINALDRLRLLKAAGPELSQNDAWLNMAALALSVVELNGVPRVMPVNERQIEAAILELGNLGLEAIADVLNDNEEAAALFSGTSEGKAVGTSN